MILNLLTIFYFNKKPPKFLGGLKAGFYSCHKSDESEV